jgi:hypothetical protein
MQIVYVEIAVGNGDLLAWPEEKSHPLWEGDAGQAISRAPDTAAN